MLSKTFGILLFAVSALAWSTDHLECMQELGLNQAKLSQYDEFRLLPEDNEELIKLAECNWTKKKFFDNDGNVDPKAIENLLKLMVETTGHVASEFETNMLNTINQGIEECSEHKFDGSKGEVALKVQNCIYMFLKKNGVERL